MAQVITADAAAHAAAPVSRAAATARTRANIVAAASRLFIERGFGAVSVRDIATEAGLSHPGVIRHFASKDEILEAVVAEFTAITEADLETKFGPTGDGLRTFGEVARRNAEIEGYLPLFSVLAGEATSDAHPAHEHFRERHAELRARSSVLFQAAIDAGELPPGTDAMGETIRLAAAWDGLQLMSLYLPGRFDLPTLLDAHLAQLRGEPVPAGLVPASPSLPLFEPDPVDVGYAPGRVRRLQIIADASTLFASRGFHATSLREIADQVGIGKSTLLHHFSSKEELLAAVIARRDATIDIRSEFAAVVGPLNALDGLAESARIAADLEPGLIELYAVLSAEAAAPTHPGHAYFERRFEWGISRFTTLFEAAAPALRADLDPVFEATWIIALWDGLQLQWLYDPESVDVAEQLAAHLAHLARPVE
ncbi:TetR/AcrR family transcriptional regulator [Agromyces allii]|nr:TetR family transcriptional regulator [Agromyces allii]